MHAADFTDAASSGNDSHRLADWEIIAHDTLDSTNLEAKRRLARGITGKNLILARAQSQGRGRLGKMWESLPGKGIWASFVLPVAVPHEMLPQGTLVLAVAVREGIYDATGLSLDIKWPNDLFGRGRKCCGLLVETPQLGSPGKATPLILGVGVNCAQTEEDFSPPLRGTATSLSLLADGAPVCCQAVLRHMAASIDRWFAAWLEHGFAPVRAAWLTHTCTVGKTVLLPEGCRYARAVARDIDEAGALLVETEDGAALRLCSGEIRFLQETDDIPS